MKKIAVRKFDSRLVSFGTEDMSRFNPQEFDVVDTTLENLLDELQFCKYEDGQVVVDEVYKQGILQKEAEKKQKRRESRQYIEDNNPANAVSVPALRERVKRLEVLLGIYKWL